MDGVTAMGSTAAATTTDGKIPKEVADALRGLVKAGIDLGVAEAVRRFAAVVPAPEKLKRLEVETLLAASLAAEVIQALRNDSGSIFQLVKEVWSRGGTPERKTAARALGRGLGKYEPHKSLGVTRDLAAMARNANEADIVGTEAIGPILEGNPTLYDRTKLFLQDNERWVRRAAIAGLVAYVTAKKKFAGLALEVILLVAEHNEKEIKAAVRYAVKEFSKIDWKATAEALAAWAATDPARLKTAREYIGLTATNVKSKMENALFTSLAKLAQTAPAPTPAKPR